MELCSWENPRVPRGRISLKIHGHHVVNMGNIWVNLGKCGKHVVNTYVNSQGQKKHVEILWAPAIIGTANPIVPMTSIWIMVGETPMKSQCFPIQSA
jgi:hypothetical protein